MAGLNKEQAQALVAWAEKRGQHWKAHLIAHWSAGSENNHLLRQVRNTLGPTWLSKTSLGFIQWVAENPPLWERVQFRICFSETTPESAEIGEHSDSGVEVECLDCATFGEVVGVVMEYGHSGWSNSDNTGWRYDDKGVQDYWSLNERQTTVHPLNPRSARYLRKAAAYVDAQKALIPR